MKKIFYLIFVLLIIGLVGCTKISPNDNEKQQIEKSSEEKESLIDLSLYLKDVERVSGYYGPISSYIFSSDNENLIYFLVQKAFDIKFTEVLMEENMDEMTFGCDRTFTFYMQDGSVNLHITEIGNMYVIYKKIVEDISSKTGYTTETVFAYKAIKPKEINYFLNFTGLGFPLNHYWCDTPVCRKYIDGLEEHIQNSIIYTVIDKLSPLNEYLAYGTIFSGYIDSYFGKYNDRYYAVIIEDCGLVYSEAEWEDVVDGVIFKYKNGNQIYLIAPSYECYDLHGAFENEILNHDDLVKIANLLN